jgi:hypothetical protein
LDLAWATVVVRADVADRAPAELVSLDGKRRIQLLPPPMETWQWAVAHGTHVSLASTSQPDLKASVTRLTTIQFSALSEDVYQVNDSALTPLDENVGAAR